MSEHYQVLARKYRPHTFEELVGQTHTVKTLVNALNNNTLHHGFLFTGTRGVGKTTIARIFAKSVNCEQGVSANPCGKCATCIEIDKGQSIDLIELDAASHTGVDHMREILENAQYLPTKDRFKVYLIDEVHMLSKSSFNALLKTLEEPPGHIKFLLATTDPQKLPITVLSRCLQFNLNKLTHDEILSQLKFIMKSEGLDYEESALAKIADFGNGSMRDALSLLDQSISFGNGSVLENDIKAMLGLVQHDDIVELATLLVERKPAEIIAFVRKLAHQGENLGNALKDLTSLIHQISIAQILPNNAESSKDVHALAGQISVHDLQLYYQIAINGQRDLIHAPSEQVGFEMTLLRMVAFHSKYESEKKTLKIRPAADKKTKATKATVEKKIEKKPVAKETSASSPTKAIQEKVETETKQAEVTTTQTSKAPINNQADWEVLIQQLPFKGAAKMLVKNTLFTQLKDDKLTLTLDSSFSNLLTTNTQKAIEITLVERFPGISVTIEAGETNNQSLAQKENAAEKSQRQELESNYLNDEGVKALEKALNTKVDVKSIRTLKEVNNV
ncbi:MAG TPA: DNA polymerase III subunit gamma/tau [Candidatus Thioglobus sp.]|jgi:DNA polymerase-3 subunit gamma/tau|nr:DNA polymerase III subunit gamma/tau [Candidatus Thioglobus sp.]HIL20937.1 DNA polymerase III subunit gamma/tau [Candidatus Thioglobus sp.]